MPDPFGPYPPGATPITDDEQEGLIPTWVATRGDLDLVEAENILNGRGRYRRRPRTADVLDDLFVRVLHRHLFGEVWRWAGTYRRTERNIGIDPALIAAAVANLVADVALWLAPDPRRAEPMDPDDVAVQVHHRMVAIHPFPNGNGRHAREYADLLLRSLGRPPFTWGARNLVADNAFRRAYLDALRAADKGDYGALRAFIRS